MADAIEGRVVASHSRWTSDGSRIVTEATVRAPDGRELVVSQLGGTVDGVTMRTFPGPELLAPGMRVALTAHRSSDLARSSHVVVDRVRVLEAPPGFVRTGPTRAGNSVYWESSCVYLTVDADGTTALPGDQEFAVVDASIAAWNDGTQSCSYLDIVQEPRTQREVGRDGVNAIVFRDTSWCRPPIGDDPERCHASSAAGVTTLVYVDDPSSPRDGAILDVDIELNGVDFAISADGSSLGSALCRADLQNTLTHELGHLLGLEHTCRTPGDPARVDDQGRPVPLCSATADPEILDSTMYPFQACGETTKRTLTDDDIDAICTIYPLANDPGTCEHVPETCSASRGGATLPALAVLVALLLFRPRHGYRSTDSPLPTQSVHGTRAAGKFR